MPSDNVERFHRLQGEWREHRRLGPDLLADDAEWVNPPDAVEPGTRRGAEAFNTAIGSIFEGWDESSFEIERVIDAGAEVVALGHLRVKGRSVAVEIVQPHGQVWTFDGGRAVRLRWFNTHAEALAAAGISGEPA